MFHAVSCYNCYGHQISAIHCHTPYIPAEQGPLLPKTGQALEFKARFGHSSLSFIPVSNCISRSWLFVMFIFFLWKSITKYRPWNCTKFARSLKKINSGSQFPNARLCEVLTLDDANRATWHLSDVTAVMWTGNIASSRMAVAYYGSVIKSDRLGQILITYIKITSIWFSEWSSNNIHTKYGE